jgi:chemotaxis protein MotA
MLPIIGTLIVLASVAVGFVLSHGQLMALWQPFELLIIGGAAFGAFVISNPANVLKSVFKNIPALLAPSAYNKALYMELLSMMYGLFNKARKEGVMSLEDPIEDPSASELFNSYAKTMKNHHAIEFITDYLRIIVGGNMNSFELENLMDIELQTHHTESTQPAAALTRVSDALPGFGIVAAVLGIVITMGALDGPASEIGAHVAAALVGTFLGILLAYGFVGPTATAMEHRAEEEAKFFECIKVCILAMVNGYNPQVAVEFGRKSIPSEQRPSFNELDEMLRESK